VPRALLLLLRDEAREFEQDGARKPRDGDSRMAEAQETILDALEVRRLLPPFEEEANCAKLSLELLAAGSELEAWYLTVTF
jgi:hypothetical protein